MHQKLNSSFFKRRRRKTEREKDEGREREREKERRGLIWSPSTCLEMDLAEHDNRQQSGQLHCINLVTSWLS